MGVIDQRVLVLEAGYRPCGTVAARRAICLILSGRAETIVYSGSFIGAGGTRTIPVPSVVRVSQVIMPRRSLRPSKQAILARDRNVCQYCGRPGDSIDHVVPRSRGGAVADWHNLVTACRPCNGRKADRTPEEAGMRLRVTPRPPTWAEQTRWALTGGPGKPVPPDWVPFLGSLAA